MTWAIWEGIEVEGPYVGLNTLFLWARPVDFSWDDYGQYPHIFFCSPWLEQEGFDEVYQALSRTTVVTLEVTRDLLMACPDDLAAHCHLMYVIDLPQAVRLKPSDTVRVTYAQFDTVSLPLLSGVRSEPGYYAHDVLLATVPSGGQVR